MASNDSYASDYGNPWATMDDFTFGQDFDLGIDWNSFGNPTYDGGTLDTFNVNTTPDDLDPFAWNNQDGSTPFDFGFGNTYDDIYGLGGIGDPLGDIGAVYIPDTTTTPTQQNPSTRPPATTPRPSTGIGSAPSSSSSRPSQSSGNAAQDIAKLVNSILQAFKPAQATNPQGQPVSQPVPAGGFDFSSLILIGAGAGVAWLILRKK